MVPLNFPPPLQTIPDMENEVFERKRKLKEAERNLTFGQASAR